MPRPNRGLVSALALTVAFSGQAHAQSSLADVQSPADLPESLRDQLPQLAELCESPDVPELPEGFECEDVSRLAAMMDEGGETGSEAPTPADPSEQVPAGPEDDTAAAPVDETAEETPAEPAAEADSVDEPPARSTADVLTETIERESAQPGAEADVETAEEAPAEPAAEAEVEPVEDPSAEPAAEAEAETTEDVPAEPAAEADVETAEEAPAQSTADVLTETVEEEAAEPAAEAEVETAEETPAESEADATTETAEETPVEATEPGDAAETAGDTAATPTEDEIEAAQEDPAPADSQAQADALAETEGEAPAAAAAAAGEGEGEPEMVEETVSEDEVRQSSEDFATQIGQMLGQGGPESGSDDGEDDNRLRNAALLGLGAVALSQILGDDGRVVSNSGDRVVVEQGGQLRVLRNDDVLLRRPGAQVQTYNYDDGSSRTVVNYEDGTQVETVRAADGRVLRRTRVLQDGSEVVLFDDTQQAENVDVNALPQVGDRRTIRADEVDQDRLAEALRAQEVQGVNRSFSLRQIRNIDRVRQLVPEISVGSINFQTGSAAIRAQEAQELATLGNAMAQMIEEDPSEVFLIEGHTDAVGDAAYNLALSDRRAESVALALTEYFDVPPENMVLQGYGESDLLVPTTDAERANRRAAVRRITPLLTVSR